MKIIKSITEMQHICEKISTNMGFVPTMGYLHEGHLSLVKAAKHRCKKTIVSIFVNPSQFSPEEDLAEYPRDLQRDTQLLADLKVDYVFIPETKAMYPDDYKTWVEVDEITRIMCGESRPTHFKGVTTIVSKLLNIINPDFMFMGEKDYQQMIVLKQMIKDLNFPVTIIGCPIIREKDGLAKSSRNKYLNANQRKQALCLYKSLKLANNLFKQGYRETPYLKEKMVELIKQNNGKIDYIAFFNPQNLQKVQKLNSGDRIALAVKIGETRLIDNMEVK